MTWSANSRLPRFGPSSTLGSNRGGWLKKLLTSLCCPKYIVREFFYESKQVSQFQANILRFLVSLEKHQVVRVVDINFFLIFKPLTINHLNILQQFNDNMWQSCRICWRVPVYHILYWRWKVYSSANTVQWDYWCLYNTVLPNCYNTLVQ